MHSQATEESFDSLPAILGSILPPHADAVVLTYPAMLSSGTPLAYDAKKLRTAPGGALLQTSGPSDAEVEDLPVYFSLI
jgi:hypothetical protein